MEKTIQKAKVLSATSGTHQRKYEGKIITVIQISDEWYEAPYCMGNYIPLIFFHKEIQLV